MRSVTFFKAPPENLQCYAELSTIMAVIVSLTSAFLYPLLPSAGLAEGRSEPEIRTRLERVARASLGQLSSEPGKPIVQTDAAARSLLEQMVTQAAMQLAARNADENEIRRAEISLTTLVRTAGSLATSEPIGGSGPPPSNEPGLIRGGGGPGAPSSSHSILSIQSLKMAMGQICPIYPFC